MNYFIGESKKLFRPKIYLGEGSEGRVYLKKDSNEAVKIFWDNNSSPMVLEDAMKMCHLKSTYFLLPRNIIYDEDGRYSGYSTKAVKRIPLISDNLLKSLPVNTLINLIKELYEEIKYLSENGLVLNDIITNHGNYLYNGKLYFIDPGYYKFRDYEYVKILYSNIRKINIFLNSHVFEEDIEELNVLLNEQKDFDLSNYLSTEGKGNESLRSLIRRKRG